MIIELSIGKSCYKFTCDETEKEKLLHLANRLNQRLEQLSAQFKNADEKTLVMICALTIEDELQQKNLLLEGEEGDDEAGKINDQDMYDSVSEVVENITNHLEKLNKKIQNY